ncbi:CDP-alcohol phosphatidyltransferase family protein [Nocardioides plantarum]|uniref:CDP-alcohol phosphatidyltransferase family protein n=1 Tax=Nocardioides plantarum TaxID=29299 RepID=A0ABV5KB53_9ACTN|nr:CDP-alcohol phosphatidyltransferase family protein [Nocardioides plantarum]
MDHAREEAYAHWSRLHGDLDPRGSFWVSGWVRLSHACARPLARRGVAPGAVTVAGVVVIALAPLLASLGAAWPLVATLVVVLGAVLDGVDGAVAAQTGTASAWGRVLDALADRVGDVLVLGSLVVLGAPLWLGAAVVVVTLLHESVRASAQAAGLVGPGVVTVWERPSRIIVAAFGTGLVGLEWVARRVGIDVLPGVDGDVLATTATAIGAVLAVVAIAHLTVVVRRSLAAPVVGQAGPTRPATIRADSTTSGSPPPGCEEPPTR